MNNRHLYINTNIDNILMSVRGVSKFLGTQINCTWMLIIQLYLLSWQLNWTTVVSVWFWNFKFHIFSNYLKKMDHVGILYCDIVCLHKVPWDNSMIKLWEGSMSHPPSYSTPSSTHPCLLGLVPAHANLSYENTAMVVFHVAKPLE